MKVGLVLFFLFSTFLNLIAQTCVTEAELSVIYTIPNLLASKINNDLGIKQLEHLNFKNLRKTKLLLNANLPYSNTIESIIQPDGNAIFSKRNFINPTIGFSALKPIGFSGGEIGFNTNLSMFNNFLNGNRQFNSNFFNIYLNQPFFKFNQKKLEEAKRRAQSKLDSISLKKEQIASFVEYIKMVSQLSVLHQQQLQLANQVSMLGKQMDKTRTLIKFGKALFIDTVSITNLINNTVIESLKLTNEINFKTQELLVIYNQNSDKVIYDFKPYVNYKLDSLALIEAYLNWNYKKLLTVDSLDIATDLMRKKKDKGINFTMQAGAGYNQSASNISQIFNNPSNRQNLTTTATMPINGWQSYRNNIQIAILNFSNYKVAKQEILQKAKLWYIQKKSSLALYKIQLDFLQLQIKNNALLLDFQNEKMQFGKSDVSAFETLFREQKSMELQSLQLQKDIFILKYSIYNDCGIMQLGN